MSTTDAIEPAQITLPPATTESSLPTTLTSATPNPRMSQRSYADAVGVSEPPPSPVSHRLPYKVEWLRPRYDAAHIRSDLLTWRRRMTVSLIHVAQPPSGAASPSRSHEAAVYLTTITSSHQLGVLSDAEVIRLSPLDSSAVSTPVTVNVCVAGVVLRTLQLCRGERGRHVCIKAVDIAMAHRIPELILGTAEAQSVAQPPSPRFVHIWSHAVREGADPTPNRRTTARTATATMSRTQTKAA